MARNNNSTEAQRRYIESLAKNLTDEQQGEDQLTTNTYRILGGRRNHPESLRQRRCRIHLRRQHYYVS